MLRVGTSYKSALVMNGIFHHYAPVNCNHCPHLRVREERFQCPAISPTHRRHIEGQNYALCPSLCHRKSPWGKDHNFKTPSFPMHCGDNQKVIARTLSQLSPPFPVSGDRGYKINDRCIILGVSTFILGHQNGFKVYFNFR